MAGRVKKKDHEKLDDTNIGKVVKLLEQDKPINKKTACELLNISYNTTRLGKIIEEYKERQEREARFRAANRGKPATSQEIQESIKGYLDGESLTDIADRLYRSPNFIKSIVEKVGVPQRGVGDYIKPGLLPEQCVSDKFEPGQIVWAAKYDALAIVEKQLPKEEYNIYRIYVLETIEEPSPYWTNTGYGGRYAVQPAFELGSLEHLKEHGVDVYKPYRQQFKDLKNSS